MNPNYFRIAMPVLFLPFKLKANTTNRKITNFSILLFLPFKLKANTTHTDNRSAELALFLPFKLKANTTIGVKDNHVVSCFCLSN
ncbi:hypothetical protein DW998_08405 [Parabacteroides distasonis]|nr:hypothetical protein DW998_08405 [Parabacteroides distasonis]